MDFEKLYRKNCFAVERLVHFKISDFYDAEDVIQETYLTAFKYFNSLSNEQSFKSWIIKIAKNMCNDYYRKKVKSIEAAEYDLTQIPYEQNIFGKTELSDIEQTIEALDTNSKNILKLYYFKGLSQKEISKVLSIPVGTVKSRLHYAKQNFKKEYPYTPVFKGDTMNRLPKILPEYKIIRSEQKPFEVEWQELIGWMIVPKLGEKITWAAYDLPERKQTQFVEMEVIGEAEIHSVPGVEIIAKEYNPFESEIIDDNTLSIRHFVAQLTDTHCRFLAESHKSNGVNKLYTFLDDEEFTKNWGFGDNNCGKETHLAQKNLINAKGNLIEAAADRYCMDVIGRYIITINKQEFDTICLMDIESYDEGVITQQYIDKNGRTVLWRRFNADDWHFDKYKQKWNEMLPANEQIIVNGKTYVHWYDCISDYII